MRRVQPPDTLDLRPRAQENLPLWKGGRVDYRGGLENR